MEYGSLCQRQLETHTFLIPKWPLCPSSSLMPALLPPSLLVTKTPSFQEARGISRDVAVSHVFDNNVTAQSLCSWREKCLGLRRAAKGQLGAAPRLCQDMFQQAAEMAETWRKRRRNPSRHLPTWGLLLTGHLWQMFTV